MTRIINGKVCRTSEDIREAVESAGGTYNECIKGDYVQVHSNSSRTSRSPKTTNTGGQNYVENLGGEVIDGDVVEISNDSDDGQGFSVFGVRLW